MAYVPVVTGWRDLSRPGIDEKRVAVTVQTNEPVIVHEGRYRLYEKPDGTLRIQYRRDGADKDDFIEMPGHLVRLAKQASEGKLSMMDMMRAMGSFMGGKLE